MNRCHDRADPGTLVDMVDDRECPTFGQLWRSRRNGIDLFINRWIPNNLSTAIVYFAARLGISPNAVSIFSGAAALFAFFLGLLLPATSSVAPIIIIYVMSQLSYVFNCADGQLARATDKASRYGDFFDNSVDIAAFTLIFGGYFGFVYRHLMASGDSAGAEKWLVLGFVFLLARTSRFAIWQRIQFEVGEKTPAHISQQGLVTIFLKNFMDMQMSLLAMLLFPFAPIFGFCVFSAQAIILAAAYVRYFARAKRLLQD